ncbi:MAG TPA: AlkA N-terminal domain-containing protein [Steroidobacteraceae bacterium]|nr:AlkA N-terminal domain-containing protein [Steroidobacteraceae bacterium]
MLTFLAARAVPGVETVRGGVYRRAVALQGQVGLLEVRPRAGAHAPRIHIRFSQPEYLLQIITRVRVMFDLAADPEVIQQTLEADEALAPLARRHCGLRLPGAWAALEPVSTLEYIALRALTDSDALPCGLAEVRAAFGASASARELSRRAEA